MLAVCPSVCSFSSWLLILDSFNSLALGSPPASYQLPPGLHRGLWRCPTPTDSAPRILKSTQTSPPHLRGWEGAGVQMHSHQGDPQHSNSDAVSSQTEATQVLVTGLLQVQGWPVRASPHLTLLRTQPVPLALAFLVPEASFLRVKAKEGGATGRSWNGHGMWGVEVQDSPQGSWSGPGLLGTLHSGSSIIN